jgi:hypothetical protein
MSTFVSFTYILHLLFPFYVRHFLEVTFLLTFLLFCFHFWIMAVQLFFFFGFCSPTWGHGEDPIERRITCTFGI